MTSSADRRAPMRISPNEQQINVGSSERWLSAIGGGVLAGWGLQQRSISGALLAALGGVLAYRGISGYSTTYASLNVNTADDQAEKGIKVKQTYTINKSPEELYTFWRNFENLPQFMDHLNDVTTISDTRSHWVAKAPAGTSVEWDAEITEDQHGELIAWRSLPGAQVDNVGSVRFTPSVGDRGTEVHVEITYDPPAGAIGAAVAKLFGEEPSQQIQEDLRRFKRLMETGEIATTEGQPHGERSALGKLLSPNN